MPNLMDYIDWRGDLTFDRDPFNEVDNLILAELSFVDLRGIVPGPGRGEGVPLPAAAEAYFAAGRDQMLEDSVLVPAEIPAMLRKMCASPRFRDLVVSACEEHLDEVRLEQFAAMAVEVPDGTVYFSFRGTDDTLVGWKEDFNMALLPVVPAQTRAVDYVKRTARQYTGRKLRFGGHSKGGNLAVYSAVNCGRAIQNRLAAVYNNDGPGFRETLLSREEHRRVADRIHTILPKSSVVGLLMEHEEDCEVVDSTQAGVLQHDGFSWCVRGPGFVRVEDLSGVELNDKLLKGWVNGMDQAQREKFADGLFDVLSASGVSTLAEMRAEGFKAAAAMTRAVAAQDRETREALVYAMRLLFRGSAQGLWDELLRADGGKKAAKRDGKKPAQKEREKAPGTDGKKPAAKRAPKAAPAQRAEELAASVAEKVGELAATAKKAVTPKREKPGE